LDAGTSPPDVKNRGTPETDWSVVETGNHIQVKATFLRPPRTPRKKKGQINRGFTYASKIRLLKKFAEIDWSSVSAGLFITLTYPDEVECLAPYERNRHRYLFLRYLEAHLSVQCGAFWRLEWKKRKSGVNRGTFYPHFHLLILNVSFIPHELIRQWWRDAIGYKGKPLSTDIRNLFGKKDYAHYVAKACYTAKDCSLDSLPKLNKLGRHWGVHRPLLVPRCQTTVYDGLNEQQIERLKQVAFEKFAWYGEYAELGFSLFGSAAEVLGPSIREICLDVGDAAE
jgi:hypothetical protein